MIKIDELTKQENKFINIALEKIGEDYKSYKKFENGTNSIVILLNDNYILKINDVITIEAEKIFFELNTEEVFEKIVYCDADYRFIIFKYISGKMMDNYLEVPNIIQQIKEIIYNYKIYDREGYGYLLEERDCWEEFLRVEMKRSFDFLNGYIDNLEYEYVKRALVVLSKYEFNKKLIHGDLGMHNIIVLENKLEAIIDPNPILGDPLYDLIFFIFSSFSITDNIKINDIFTYTDEPKEKVAAMIIIILYNRMSRCIKYYKNEIDRYKPLWETSKKYLL